MIDVVRDELLRAAAAEAPPNTRTASCPRPKPKGRTPRSGADRRVARCRAYLKTVDPAVSGEHGHDQTFMAARIIWADFAIDEAEGYPLLEEFNGICNSPWDEHESARVGSGRRQGRRAPAAN